MSLNLNRLHRRGFIKIIGSTALAISAWGLRLVPEVGGARGAIAQAAGSSIPKGHPLSTFDPVQHVELEGDRLVSATTAILGSDDVRQAATSFGFDRHSLGQGRVSLERDANDTTLTVGTWVIDEKHALIYAHVDRQLEWFKSFSMVVTTDSKIGQVRAHTLNGRIPKLADKQPPSASGLAAVASGTFGVTEADAYACCGAYYNCCYDRWGNWQEYWQWTGMSPCGVNWGCAADVCGAPCAAACLTGVGCVGCILLLCGYAAIRCTYWCPACYYCYDTA